MSTLNGGVADPVFHGRGHWQMLFCYLAHLWSSEWRKLVVSAILFLC